MSPTTRVFETPVYQSIQKYRNEMLEDLLHKTLARSTSLLSGAIQSIERAALVHLSKLYRGTHGAGVMESYLFEQEVTVTLLKLAPELAHLYERLARWSSTLTTASEFEAISQAKQDTHRRADAKPQRNTTTSMGHPVMAQVEVYLAELRRRIADAFDMARVRRESPQDGIERIRRAFPAVKRLPSRVLTKVPKDLREADTKPKRDTGFTAAIVDDDDWSQMVQEYRDEYLPDYRDPRLADETDNVTYDWKFEQDTTQKLVERVRQGQVEAANQLGVKDFIWVAVVDKATDDCCLKRDGLTTSQIEQKLSSEWKDDDERAVYPPLHWNCRCVLAPMADTIEPAEPFDREDFDEWLAS